MLGTRGWNWRVPTGSAARPKGIAPSSWVDVFVAQVRNLPPVIIALYRQGCEFARNAWQRVQARRQLQLASKRLCLCESISLGDKRFLAIVRVDGQHFLVGGAPSNVCMLTQLAGDRKFAELLQKSSPGERLQA